jgi:hypothetical protein
MDHGPARVGGDNVSVPAQYGRALHKIARGGRDLQSGEPGQRERLPAQQSTGLDNPHSKAAARQSHWWQGSAAQAGILHVPRWGLADLTGSGGGVEGGGWRVEGGGVEWAWPAPVATAALPCCCWCGPLRAVAVCNVRKQVSASTMRCTALLRAGNASLSRIGFSCAPYPVRMPIPY